MKAPLVIPRGWHSDALPDGRYVSLVAGSHLETDQGRVDFQSLEREPLYVRLSEDGSKFAGQSHFTPDTVEYSAGAWRVIPQEAVGVSPVIYDLGGRLVISTGAVGSQGFRYVADNGRIVSGDDTYAPALGFTLYEWTNLSRNSDVLFIGQGPEDGIHVWDGEEHRLLVTGACRFVRARRTGDDVSVAAYRILDGTNTEAVLAWATVAELRALPVVDRSMKPVAPNVPSFQLGGMWVADDDAPGNCAIGTFPYVAPQPFVIAEERTVGSVPAERLGGLLVYLPNPDDAALVAMVERGKAIAEEYGVPPFIYDDRPEGRYELVKRTMGGTPFVWMPMWYRQIGESVEAFVRRVLALARSLNGAPFLPAIRAYCSLNNTDKDNPFDAVPEREVVEALNALIAADALKLPGCLGPLFFAWNRGDGALNRPAVKAAVELWLRTPTTITDARAWAAQFLNIPEVPMNVPDHFDTVRDLFATDAFSLATHTSCGIFTDAVARALHARDPRWGHLIKKPGQNQYPEVDGHAVDAVLYRFDEAGKSVAVDIISANATPEAKPSWGEDIPRYSPGDWRDPGPQPASVVARPPVAKKPGMTAFDWCTHRDPAWLQLHVDYNLPFVRLVPQSVYRTPRSLAEGVAQLDAALPLIAARGLGAMVTINCDSKDYGMSRDDVRANTATMNAILVKHLPLFQPGMLAADLGNENSNGNEQPFMTDPFFLLELDALVDAQIPLAWGTVFGSEVGVAVSGGSWIAHHSDRGLSPEDNGAIMAAAQARYGKDVWDREPLGFAEPGTRGQRTWDVAYARGLGAAAKQHGLGLIYHTQAGLGANVAEFGEYHRSGAIALLEGLGGAVVTPPAGDDLVDLGEKSRASAIKIAYRTLLDRDPDPVGVQIYTDRLKSGWTVQQMEDDIRASPEYLAKK